MFCNNNVKKIQGEFPVIKKQTLAKQIYDFTILCPQISNIAYAGQFVHVKAKGFTLRRPISICDINKEKGTIRIVFEVRGKGTYEISKINEGDIIDILGPLGHGFDILDNDKKVIVIGGGIGVPPMLEVAKTYKENATVLIGFKSSNFVILDEDFKNNKNDIRIATDDGTKGKQGFVTELLNERLKESYADIIYACGPTPMLKSIIDIANKNDIRCQVSLEERMGCGIGACLVCACKTINNDKENYSHVCKDGPVFESREIIFE